MMSYQRVVIPPDSERAVRTAACELAETNGCSIVEEVVMDVPRAGDIVLLAGDSARRHPRAAAALADVAADEEWELVDAYDGALLIAGRTPRNVCRAVLGWLADPAREAGRLSRYRHAARATMWDNSMNQMYRFSTGFDRRRHIRELARLGHTGVEVNRYADAGGYHVRHRKFAQDPYGWYLSYGPALDAFVRSSLTEGLYRAEELQANLDDLLEAVDMARDYGLEPGFVCYEPRCVADEFFDRHPMLRGSRTDHPGRSLHPRYAMDIAHPLVLDHYAQLIARLMTHVPDLRYLVFWTQDSGSGIPFTHKLYPGPNGSYLARSKTVEGMVADFTRTLVEAGRAINPAFEVVMAVNHEYTPDERRAILAALPAGVTVSHPVGGAAMEPCAPEPAATLIPEARAAGVEPYGLLAVTGGFDPEPIVAVPTPGLLRRKLSLFDEHRMERTFSHGGLFSPPQCPYNVNQELYAEWLRHRDVELESFLHEVARRWCDDDDDAARQLVEAWRLGDRAIDGWPRLNWYHAGPGPTQARWLTRPLVPDITKLAPAERAAWERALFTLAEDVGRVNVAFEGGVRMFRDADLIEAVEAYDRVTIPRLTEAVSVLDRALRAGEHAVLEDQRDRYKGFLLRCATVRNLFEAQWAINQYLRGDGDEAAHRARLAGAIRAEMDVTRDWIDTLTTSRTVFFHTSEVEETPFLHKTPVEDFTLKLAVMRDHTDDEPGPRLAELDVPRRDLLFNVVPW